MFVAKPVHALQFHDNFLVNQQIGTVFAHTLPLVADWKRSLIFGTHSAQRELAQHGPFIDLFQESGSQGLRDLEGGANYGLRQVRFQSVCIRVHPWPYAIRSTSGEEISSIEFGNW